jgi:hypothetical protein
VESGTLRSPLILFTNNILVKYINYLNISIVENILNVYILVNNISINGKSKNRS